MTLESYYFTVIIFSKKIKKGHIYFLNLDSNFANLNSNILKLAIFKSSPVIKVSLNESYYTENIFSVFFLKFML